MFIFAVRDAKLGEFLNPFFLPTKMMALRGFSDECQRADCPLSAHPEDYELFELGEFEPESGRLIPHQSPISVGHATEYARRAEGPQPVRPSPVRGKVLNG